MTNGTQYLRAVQKELYRLAGGSLDSNDVRAARISTRQRIELICSPQFRSWVDSRLVAGKQVFWIKDMDGTQRAGDVFVDFFRWLVQNNKFCSEGRKHVESFLRRRLATVSPFACATGDDATPQAALRLWDTQASGFGLLDFWRLYWLSQIGVTREERATMLAEFAPHATACAFPGVIEENLALEAAGVHVVLVTAGDQELAVAVAPGLGIKPENVVGSPLQYTADGYSNGLIHSYDILDQEWADKPQPGKDLNFRYWIWCQVANGRWGWSHRDDRKMVIAGIDGDSPSADLGMMLWLLGAPATLGHFMVSNPGDTRRLERFYYLSGRYGSTLGRFITLLQESPQSA